ncbi:MAG TPA: hypothetical protein DIW31_08890 [Bacteroidales bacterium]|nr:hypothetical protein [Bacteroidales bacterium]
MRKSIIASLILVTTSLQGQNLKDSFTIGNFVGISNNDTLVVFYNCMGTIVNRKCAEFYRKGRIDSTRINFSGNITDYYLNNVVALKATIKDDYLNGKATYYHENGAVKSIGNYKQDIKIGTWKYFYKNGQTEKIIYFIDGKPYIFAYYDSSGKQLVANGNGEYKGEYYPARVCEPITVQGSVINGKMHGKWSSSYAAFNQHIGDEFFENGVFIKGVSHNYTYTDKQRIFIDGYCSNENLHMDENSLGCPGDSYFFWQYKGQDFHQGFFPALQESLDKLTQDTIRNQWIIVGLSVNKKTKLTSVDIKSSINDTSIENKIYEIIFSMKQSIFLNENSKQFNSNLFFTILFRDNQVIIPAYFLKQHL